MTCVDRNYYHTPFSDGKQANWLSSWVIQSEELGLNSRSCRGICVDGGWCLAQPPGEPVPGQMWPEVLSTSLVKCITLCIQSYQLSSVSYCSLSWSHTSAICSLIICISTQTCYTFFYLNKHQFLTPFSLQLSYVTAPFSPRGN